MASRLFQVELDDFCTSVIQARVADKMVPVAPLFRDVAQFVPDKGLRPEGIIGGFPCQAA